MGFHVTNCCKQIAFSFTTDSQQRYEAELLELQEKLQSFADQEDGSHLSESQNDHAHSCSSGDSLENEECKTDKEQTVKNSEQSETVEHRFHEILNRELSMFCEKMCTSRTGDVSNEQETNQRHDVAEAYENDEDNLADNGESEMKQSEECLGNVGGNQGLMKEVDFLKKNLIHDLIPLLPSNVGKIFLLLLINILRLKFSKVTLKN